MPLWIPVAIASIAIDKHRMRKAARSFKCASCGEILGVAAIKRADEEWADDDREFRREHPNVKFDVHRIVHAICLNCGTEYMYRYAERTFTVEELRPRAD
jgi:hypothetical protein